MTERANWKNQTLVREPDRQHWRRSWRIFLSVAVAFAPSIVYVIQVNECLELRYQLAASRAEIEQRAEEEQRLTVERARLEALDEVEIWAVHKRGLRFPEPEQVIVVCSDVEQTEDLLARAPEIGQPSPEVQR